MKKKSIQRGAHTLTFVAACWTLFSAFGVFDWLDGRRRWNDPNALPDLVIWGLHLLLIAGAVYAWRHEKAQEVIWIGEDDEIFDEILAVKPEEINVGAEKEKLKQLIVSQVTGVAWMLAFVWVSITLSNPAQLLPWMRLTVKISGAFLLLNIAFGVVKYAILRYRAKSRESNHKP